MPAVPDLMSCWPLGRKSAWSSPRTKTSVNWLFDLEFRRIVFIWLLHSHLNRRRLPVTCAAQEDTKACLSVPSALSIPLQAKHSPQSNSSAGFAISINAQEPIISHTHLFAIPFRRFMRTY